MTKEMNEMKQELVELRSDPSFQRLDQEMFEARQQRNIALGEKNDYRDEMKEEKSKYWSEEKEARRRQEDIDRLRRDRNEWREQYDELLAQWAAEWDDKGLEYSEEGEAHEARSEVSEAIASFIDVDRPKISRKEADKVVIPNWPKIHELEYWKSQVTSNIVAACGDLDHDAWVRWIAPSFRQLPDIDGDLAKSGDQRYNSIDVKLASALMSMMQNGGDQAREVLHEAKLKMAKGCRGSTPTLLKGRQLLAMVIDSFRSASNTDLVFTIKHLYDLPYPGDNEIVLFKSQWNEVLEQMRPGDVPNDIALRDILYDKVKVSKLMAFDLHYYEGKEDNHAEKTYQYLMNMISKHIKLKREEKNRESQEQSLKNLRNRHKALPAANPNDAREHPRLRQKHLLLLLRKTPLVPFSQIQGTRYMRRARRERGKEKVKVRARARRVIDRDLLVRLGPQQKKRKSHVDFTLDQEQHVLKVETASIVTQRIHQGLTALRVEGVVYVIPTYKVNVRKGKTANMPMTKEH